MADRPEATVDDILSHSVPKEPHERTVAGKRVYFLPIKGIGLRNLQKEAATRPKAIGEDEDWAYRILIIMRCTCDAEGNRIFSEEHYGAISDLEPAYLAELILAALDCYGMRPNDDEEDEEDARVGKSDAIQCSGGGSE